MGILIAAGVSVLTQILKQYVQSTWEKLAIVLALSLIGAAIYSTLVAYGYWQSFVGVLITAGAFYTFIIQRFE